MKSYYLDPKTGRFDEIIDMVLENGVYRIADDSRMFPEARLNLQKANPAALTSAPVINNSCTAQFDKSGDGIERILRSYKSGNLAEKGIIIDLFA